MARFFPVFVAICLSLTAAPSFSAAQTEKDGSRPGSRVAESAAASSTLDSPVFQLKTLPDDSPEMAVKKAALRLFNGYNLTVTRLTACKAADPQAGKALGNYNSRNGNTVSLATRVIKRLGGISPGIKQAMDRDLEERRAAQPSDCRTLIQAVNDGQRDIYKAPDFISDYKLIQTMK